MNRNVILTAIVLVFFSTWFNSPPTYASFNKPLEGNSESVVASSRTTWVPDNHTKIQWAIGNASAGDTIFVRAGTYYEHVTIDKSISLIGENKHNTIIDGNGTRTIVSAIANSITLSGFTIQNGQLGIWLWRSTNNAITSNTASSNSYGIYVSESSNNIFTGNAVSSNSYGIYLHYSSNNVLLDNIVSNSRYGIYLHHSRDHVVTGNAVTNNDYGIRLDFSSNNNTFTGNIVSSSENSGIRLTFFSSNNIIYHNNFIKNAEPVSSIDSVNSWDNGAEGNYWNGYVVDDANWDGIGDTPYLIDENNQDNCPLMAMFLQFTIVKENQSYNIDAVSSSTISNFQFGYDLDSRTDAVSFKVNDAEGKGFCRISIAHALIGPPYAVKVDQNSPLYFEIVYTNGTHTWLYFTYDPSEHEVTMTHMTYPEQLALSRWAILGLSAIIVALLLVSIKYYRMFNEQKKVIQAYDRELGSFPVSHTERARARLIKDVIERKEKINRFKKKYGINIQPAGTLEDLMEKMGVKKES